MVIDFIFLKFFSFTCKLASRGYYAFHKLSFKRQKNVLNLANYANEANNVSKDSPIELRRTEHN